MIKAVIFDLDGVLVDADKLHFDALNLALVCAGVGAISWQEHLTIYKGLPTLRKLLILTERRGLSSDLYNKINKNKQIFTLDLLEDYWKPDAEKAEMMKLFKQKGYKIYVCSNAIRSTVKTMLSQAQLDLYLDGYLSNQDVENPKPDPEIYLKAFRNLEVSPTECLIVEDSDVGYKAAVDSGAYVCKVNGPEEVNYYRVLKDIMEADTVNIIIPAAGQGKRFAEKGYVHPKPLIDVQGQPMLQWVIDNFDGFGNITLLMQREHISKYCVEDILDKAIIPVDGITDGAACTVLLAKDIINNNNELIIANSDQYISYAMEVHGFLSVMREKNADGGMMVFYSDNPKWSYAKLGDNGLVVEVAEKKVISNNATVGIYYFKHGKDFVKYAKQMITKNIRVNNEFYVCPVFNELIADNKKIVAYTIVENAMKGLGTPEDLERFLCTT